MKHCEYCKYYILYKYKYENQERTRSYCTLTKQKVGNAGSCNKFSRDPWFEVREQ